MRERDNVKAAEEEEEENRTVISRRAFSQIAEKMLSDPSPIYKIDKELRR